MEKKQYKRCSINLDDQSHEKCKIMANVLAVSISGIIRLLVHDAFDRLMIQSEKEAKRQII
jgi:hypothetical protein